MTKNTQEMALRALPHLVYAAQTRDTLTYGQLARKINSHHRPIRFYLAYIRDEICRPRDLPLLNCLVVNQKTKLPGDSYLYDGSKAATTEEKLREFESFRDQVFQRDDWDKLLNEFDVSPLTGNESELKKEARTYNQVIAKYGSIGEGARHKALKEFVSQNPSLLGLTKISKVHVEFQFLSGDEADVVFDCGDKKWVIAEIKIGLRGELVKGIFQSIKYRALMCAQEEASAKVFLVAYNIPKDIAEFAAKHKVECVVVPEEKMKLAKL